MGVDILSFNDFAVATSEAWMSEPGKVLNEAQRRTYFFKRFVSKDIKENVSGGSKLKDAIMFDEQNTAETYKPNAVMSDQMPQVLEEVEVPWRFLRDHCAWTEEEIQLNTPDGAGRTGRHKAWKRLLDVKRQRMWTSFFNKFDDLLLGVPSNAQMEATSGKDPYSLFAFVNEETNGLYSGFSTVATINPVTVPKWVPYRDTYDVSDPAPGVAADDGLLDAFGRAHLRTKFETPGSHQEYFENERLNKQFWITSLKGRNLYERILRESKDHFVVSGQDPAHLHPKYNGIDILYMEKLDDIAIYAGPSSTIVDEDAATNAGPRFYGINANYIKPVFHEGRYIEKKEPINSRDQPTTWTENVFSTWNLFCHSRRRLSVISPV